MSGGELKLVGIVDEALLGLALADAGPVAAVGGVGDGDLRLADLDQDVLDHVLELLDVDEEGAVLLHAELDLGLDLGADRLLDADLVAGGQLSQDEANDILADVQTYIGRLIHAEGIRGFRQTRW